MEEGGDESVCSCCLSVCPDVLLGTRRVKLIGQVAMGPTRDFFSAARYCLGLLFWLSVMARVSCIKSKQGFVSSPSR